MFSYEFYKVLHLSSILLFSGTLGISFALDSPPKWIKILSGLSSLLIFVAAMGLMARLGISHKGAWPPWILIKLTLWMALAIGTPILSRRLKGPCRIMAFGPLMVLFFIAAYMGVYRPF